MFKTDLVFKNSVHFIKIPITSKTILGPKLPFRIEESVMFTSPNNCGVVIIGGYILNTWQRNYGNRSKQTESNKILELWGNSIKSMEWITLEQTLTYGRRSHIAFIIPDELTAFQHRSRNTENY